MSETLIIDPEAEPIRHRRIERSERVLTEGDNPGAAITLEEAPQSDLSPEEALADARRTVQAKQAEADDHRRRATEAQQDAQRARQEAQQAAVGRHQDRATAVASALEAAKSDIDRASTTLRMAREAGDIDAEIKASRDINSADFRFNSARAELQYLSQGMPPAQQAPQQSAPAQQYSAAAQSWINAHPRFNEDASYQGAMVYAHGRALERGIAVDSPAYFEALDAAAAGMGDEGSRQAMTTEPRRPPSATSTAAPPSRGDGRGSSSGSGTVQTLLGPLKVTRHADGKIGISIPNAVRSDFEDGARVANMSLAQYAYEQVRIADERRAGGNGDLTTEEGRSYR